MQVVTRRARRIGRLMVVRRIIWTRLVSMSQERRVGGGWETCRGTSAKVESNDLPPPCNVFAVHY